MKVPELDTCVFIVPSSLVKNGEERLVVLNREAKSVVDSMRGLHPTHVFVRVPSRGEPRPIPKMYGTGWKSARERAADKWAERHGEPASEGFRKFRVHDLKHTFGRRLRAAGVSFEDRQDSATRSADHDARLSGRAEQPACGSGQGVRRGRVPQPHGYVGKCACETGAPGEIRTPDLMVRRPGRGKMGILRVCK